MTALACARESLLGPMTDRATAYVSDQAHSSLARAARVLGFRPEQVRVLPVDERYGLRVDALRGAMEADLEAGREPLFVSASAGSTNTGAVDPLNEIADACAEHGAWLHVDAAYGGFAALTERGRAALAGIERADSITLDPHKWLYQPFECGCLLVRQGERLRRAFEITPDYLKDARTREGEVNFSDMGLQLTRGFRALKIWLSIKFFGVRAFTEAIDRCLDLAQAAQRRIEESAELELLSPAALGVVGFRRLFGGGDRDEAEVDALNAQLVNRLAASGDALISSTRLEGRYALRLCILNHTSGAEDVDAVLDWLETQDVSTAPEHAADVHAYTRDESVVHALPSTGPPSPTPPESRPDLDAIRGLALFADLDDARLQGICELAVEERAEAGQKIVRQWDAGSDFYVLIAGQAEVTLGDGAVHELGPGDFFGEVAALEWGAGFSYGRTASVVAATEIRLVRLSSEALAAVVADCPAVGERVRQVRRARLTVRRTRRPG
jgi:glutamate/tyrosine decarboxylase-like PLP-dependent enzyme